MPVDIKIEGTKEISNALVEIFSPVTNLLGTLGDRVRIYRQLSLLRSLKRAKEIASEEGLKLNEPPLKFLVPYLEDCSLESPDDDVLIEMWAKLLASSAAHPRPEHNIFIRVLRELTASEAKLIEYLVSPNSHQQFKGHWHLEDVSSDWYDPFVFIKLRDCIAELSDGLNDDTDFAQLENSFREKAEPPGSVVYFFNVGKGKQGAYPLDDVHNNSRGPIDDDFERTSIAILKSLGLIGDYVSPEFWFGEFVFDVRAYYLTELGAHFIEACTRLSVSGTIGISSDA